jgi:hypothetical protein
VVFILYGFCGLAAASALLLTETHERYHGFIIVVVCLVALYGLRHLGYTEFSVAGRLALDGSFRRQLNEQIALIGFEEQLSTCATLEQCQEVLYSACPHFGFSGMELHLDNLVVHRVTTDGWHVRIDFPEHGYINLTRDPEITGRGTAAVRFIDSLHRVIEYKLNQLNHKEPELTPYAHAE